MRRLYKLSNSRIISYISVSLLAASSLAFSQVPQSSAPLPAQDQTNPGGGWRRVGDPGPGDQGQASPDPNYAANQSYGSPGYPNGSQPYPTYQNPGAPGGQTYPAYQNPGAPGNQPYSQPNGPNPNYPGYSQPAAPVPAQITVPAGTFITVRVNQLLSSDRNQAGDAFWATLSQPLVVNGVVVAEPGQTVAGRVVEAEKAGRIEGVSRLRVQLTEVTLVDGQQVPIQTQLIGRKGDTSVGRDAAAIGGTTALGAAIGAAAGWGRGAAIGAGAGAAVGVLGVLLTRGTPSVIYPEQELTFRIEAPVTISTEHAPQAFRYVQPNEYDRPYPQQAGGPSAYPAPSFGYGYGYSPYTYGYPYYPYWGPSFSFYVGPGYWYGGRYFYGRPYYYGRGFVAYGRRR
jgi:hypothetical protein